MRSFILEANHTRMHTYVVNHRHPFFIYVAITNNNDFRISCVLCKPLPPAEQRCSVATHIKKISPDVTQEQPSTRLDHPAYSASPPHYSRAQRQVCCSRGRQTRPRHHAGRPKHPADHSQGLPVLCGVQNKSPHSKSIYSQENTRHVHVC